MQRLAIPIPDGDITYYPDFMAAAQARQLFEQLQTTLAWQQDTIQVYGRAVTIPRLNAWYGDPGVNYQYSGLAMVHNAWTPELEVVKAQLESVIGLAFNGMLANLYRDGRDSVSWHADDEPELGSNPVIASLSLGGERRFVLKHKYDKQLKPVEINLQHGSLLVMAGATQHHWHHQLPKTRKPVGPRVNLTFRRVVEG